MTTLLLTDTATIINYEPLIGAAAVILFSLIIFLGIKGKLRDWFIR